MALETYLSPPTSTRNVLMVSEVHLTPSTLYEDTSNTNLANILVKSASEAILGLSLTAANYDEAVAILNRRFGTNS